MFDSVSDFRERVWLQYSLEAFSKERQAERLLIELIGRDTIDPLKLQSF